MPNTQTIDNTPSDPRPTIEEFREVVNEVLQANGQTNVVSLCDLQIQNVINELAQYFGDPASSKSAEPDVTLFKTIFSNFQQQQERLTFADLTDADIEVLIDTLAPHFIAA